MFLVHHNSKILKSTISSCFCKKILSFARIDSLSFKNSIFFRLTTSLKEENINNWIDKYVILIHRN